MKPGGLLLLVGSVALWTGLPAAPPRRTHGQPPLSPSSAPGEAPQDRISQEEEATLACAMVQEPEEVRKSPLPQGKKSRADGERVAEEPQSGKGGSLPAKAAGPAPPGKLISKTDPQLERPPANHLEAESSAGPGPAEKPQEPSERDPGPQLGGSPVSRERRLPGGNVPWKETSSSLGRPKLASTPALPNLGTWNPVWDPNNEATSGGKLNASKKPTPSTPRDKPTSGTGKPTSTERPDPGSGHSIQDKPKPGSATGPLAHEGPSFGEKPASNSGPEAPGRPLAGEKPTSGEKPSSPPGHEKHPSADESEGGGKPEAEKDSKPEKEAEEKKEGEEDLFAADDDEEEEEEEEEEGEKGKEKEEGTAEGNKDGDDAFDKELDYGLNNLPFDAYSYHDAWSDEGAEVADVGLRGEVTALPEAGEANNDGKPIFDAWGDLVGGSRP